MVVKYINPKKKVAAELRQIAANLEAADAQAPRTVADVITRYAPQVACINIALPLRPLGSQGFDARHFMVRRAADQLGRHIADTIEFELDRRPDRIDWLGPQLGFCEEAVFRASVYAFTPPQLKDLLQKAFDAGRNS